VEKETDLEHEMLGVSVDLREVGIDVANRIRLAQVGGQVAGFCEHDNEPSGSIKKTGYSLTS
jgi:hypothetical protein